MGKTTGDDDYLNVDAEDRSAANPASVATFGDRLQRLEMATFGDGRSSAKASSTPTKWKRVAIGLGILAFVFALLFALAMAGVIAIGHGYCNDNQPTLFQRLANCTNAGSIPTNNNDGYPLYEGYGGDLGGDGYWIHAEEGAGTAVSASYDDDGVGSNNHNNNHNNNPVDMKMIAMIVGITLAVATLATFAVVGSKFSKISPERKAHIKAILLTDEVGAIKARNWRHPVLVGSKLVAVACLLLSWIFVVANKIGFGKMNAMFVVPLNFGCMLTNVWFLHKYAAGGGFGGHDWRREFVACGVAAGLLFVSCCMISAAGSSFSMMSRFGKVPGLAMLNAGAAFSWFGLIAMLVSLFGAWTKRQNPDVDGSTNGTAYQPSEVPALAALPDGHEQQQQQQQQQHFQQQGYPPQAQSNSAAPAAAASAENA